MMKLINPKNRLLRVACLLVSLLLLLSLCSCGDEENKNSNNETGNEVTTQEEYTSEVPESTAPEEATADTVESDTNEDSEHGEITLPRDEF